MYSIELIYSLCRQFKILACTDKSKKVIRKKIDKMERETEKYNIVIFKKNIYILIKIKLYNIIILYWIKLNNI